MKIYLYDYATRIYVGERFVTADDFDPQRPDLLMLPGNATLIQPPRCGKNLWPVWHEGQWVPAELKPVENPFEQFHCE